MPDPSTRRQQWLDHAAASATGDPSTAALLAQLRHVQAQLRTLNASRLVRAPIGTIATAILIALIIAGALGAITISAYIALRTAQGH